MKSKLQKFLLLSACVLMTGTMVQARNGNRGGQCGAGCAWDGQTTQNTQAGGRQLRQCRRQGRQQNDAVQASGQGRRRRCRHRNGNGTGVCPNRGGTTGTCTAAQNCTADDCPRCQARRQQRKCNGAGANNRR